MVIAALKHHQTSIEHPQILGGFKQVSLESSMKRLQNDFKHFVQGNTVGKTFNHSEIVPINLKNH